jgi:hypothetical protein
MDLHESTTSTSTHPLMTALGRGLPITLLVDLIDPNGPRSFEMYERERTPTRVITIPEPVDAQTA